MVFRLAAVLGALLALVARPAPPTVAAAVVPDFDHVFQIVMENHAYGEIIGNTIDAPYLNQLAAQYGVAANYVAVAHPSLPNYLALVGGDTFGITTDCATCFINAPNLVADRIAPSGRTWKAYMENMPGPCFAGDAYPYAQKHDPFMYFDDVRTTSRCSGVVPLTSLAADLASASTTPAYAWLTPNLCNDMHDCSIATGDAWLRQTIPAILSSPAYTTQNSLVLITWDEDDSTQSNQVPTLVISKSVPSGFRSATRYSHYSLLKTIEQAWGLAPLTANDAAAVAMTDFFAAGPAGTSIIRVNAGGPAYTGSDGRVWQADSGFNTGRTYATSAPIGGASDAALYDSQRYGTVSYSFPVTNGTYAVTLKFAELYWTAPGQRVFNVSINSQPVLSNFDILSNVPRNTGLDKTYVTSVTNGSATITFTTVVDNAVINAIEIAPTP
jgi:phosphatidylinositol-3-phosphatase